MIYVLLLEKGKIYVGYSERPVGERFLEHFNYQGSKWTTQYRPIQVLEIQNGGIEEENEMTLKMMSKYGWWNVRGGIWCQMEMNTCPVALLDWQQIKLPTPLRSPGLNKYDSNEDGCSRCGRHSHSVGRCYAKTHIQGHILGPTNVEASCNSRKVSMTTTCDKYIESRGGVRLMKGACVRDANNISDIQVTCGPVREVGQAIRRSNPNARLQGYYFQSPISIIYPDRSETPRIAIRDVVLEPQRSTYNTRYGTEFVSVGIPSKVYNYILQAACKALNVKPKDNVREFKGLKWPGYVSCKKAKFSVTKGSSTKDMPFTKVKQLFNENAKGFGFFELKLKLSSIDNPDVADAINTGLWELGLVLTNLIIYASTETKPFNLTMDNNIAIGVPKVVAVETIQRIFAETGV